MGEEELEKRDKKKKKKKRERERERVLANLGDPLIRPREGRYAYSCHGVYTDR